jgi:hypothetical protein
MPVASIVNLQPQADGARSNFCLGTLLRAHDRTKPDPQVAAWFEGKMDEVHVSGVARYREDFEPKPRFEPDEHTLALYHFDEGQGDVLTDSSSHNHHGKIMGAKWVPVDEAVVDRLVAFPTTGFALEFDGQTTFIEFPTLQPDFSQPFTFEAVVEPHPEPRKPVAGAGIWPSVGKVFSFVNRDNANYWMVFNHVGGGWAVRYRTPKSDLMTYTLRQKLHGVRHHIAGVWTGENFNWFVDGQLSNGFAEAKLPDPSHGVGNNGVASMGTESSLEGKTSRHFRGTLDEVRISRGARYQMNYTPASRLEPDADTLALYHFDEGQGDVLTDSSGHNHHGKIIGAKWVRASDSPSAAGDDWIELLPAGSVNWLVKNVKGLERHEQGLLLDATNAAVTFGNPLQDAAEIVYQLRIRPLELGRDFSLRVNSDCKSDPPEVLEAVLVRYTTGPEMHWQLWKRPKNGSAKTLASSVARVETDRDLELEFRLEGGRATVTVDGQTVLDKDGAALANRGWVLRAEGSKWLITSWRARPLKPLRVDDSRLPLSGSPR